MHEFHILVLNFNLTKPAFHSCSRGSLPSRAHVKLTAEMETMRAWLFFPLLPHCCGFSTATEQVNLYIKGFPLQTGTLSPVVRLRELLLWSHTSNRLFHGLAVWRGRGVGIPVSGEVHFYSKRRRGKKKRKKESYYRGLPVWEADLRVNLFSCLTSLSPSKPNRAPNSHAG